MRIYNFYHSELMTSEAPAVIMAKVERLDELKEKYYELIKKKNELETTIKKEEEELNKIRGVLYDYIDEPDEPVVPHVTETVNILLKGVSNSKL